MRDVATIPVAPTRVKRALTVADIRAIRAWLATDTRAADRDLPDLVSFLAATGCRIGEALAATWNHLDLDPASDTGSFTVAGTVVRIKGEGLRIQSAPKTRAGARRLQLPSWCVRMLRNRYQDQHRRGEETDTVPELVFPAPLSGQLRDPSNTRRGLRDAFADMGIDGLTSHAFRRAVATIMDDAGLTARQAADQLGHARPSITQDIYMNRATQPTGAAALLERHAVARSCPPIDSATSRSFERCKCKVDLNNSSVLLLAQPTGLSGRGGFRDRLSCSRKRTAGVRVTAWSLIEWTSRSVDAAGRCGSQPRAI